MLPEPAVSSLAARAALDPEYGPELSFDIDPFRKHCILNGLGDIALTLERTARITSYEENIARRPRYSFIHV